MRSPTLFLSHRLETLLDQFVSDVQPFKKQLILVPHALFKQWLLVEIAKRKTVAIGLSIWTVQEAMNQLGRGFPNATELHFLIYRELIESKDPALRAYLDGKGERIGDLCAQLTTLFSQYGLFGKGLFAPSSQPIDWQRAILQKLFVQGPWRPPLFQVDTPVFCFATDFLPPSIWQSLFQAPSLSLYLFSPCAEFWMDLCTDRERKRIGKYWKKRGASQANRDLLDQYLREAPPLLAGWGRLGRETLQTLDAFDLQIEESYPDLEPCSLLKKIQGQLLYFRKEEALTADDSIEITLAGSCRLREVEILRDSILRLKSQKGLFFNEIAVLAPDLGPYAPLIEWIFADEIPYRLLDLQVGPESSFAQGLVRLSNLIGKRWEREEVLALFETPAFYRKQGWDGKKLDLFREWIETVSIEWGIDEEERKTIFQQLFSEAHPSPKSWQNGIDRLLERSVFLLPGDSALHRLAVNLDELEQLISTWLSLKEALTGFKEAKTLYGWADALGALVETFLQVEFADEADGAALSGFREFLTDLRRTQDHFEGVLFPFSAVQRLLLRPCFGNLHLSHLHAVRFMPLEKGAIFPAKAIFLIGMDEESFPRNHAPTSLDLLKNGPHFIPTVADRDRYSFLQALFSAEEFLRISYCHLSQDEGKEMGPSLLVAELLNGVEGIVPIIPPSLPFDARVFSDERCRSYSQADFKLAQGFYAEKQPVSFWPPIHLRPPFSLPEGERTISIAELSLLARHPWKFYLKKAKELYLESSLEPSFNLSKGLALRASLTQPLERVLTSLEDTLPAGPIGAALRLEIAERAEEWQRQLGEWGVEPPIPLLLRDTCRDRRKEASHIEMPPLEIEMENGLKVRLVGEIKQVTSLGLLSTQDDQIDGCLKIWPEALVVALALDTPHILFLKNGKKKKIEKAEASLKAYLRYYFHALTVPSPLLLDWCDPILRKGAPELEKKMKGKTMFEDPVVEWVMSRGEVSSAAAIISAWQPFLKESFEQLTALYPTRGKIHAAL